MKTDEETENSGSVLGEKKRAIKREEDHREDLVSFVRLLYGVEDIPEKFADWSYERQKEWIVTEGASRLEDLPETLIPAFLACVRPGDCGRPAADRPEWLDMEMFRRGQKFAMEHIAGICYANMISLYMIFAFKCGLTELNMTNRSNTPYRAFRRYLSTVNRTRNWYTTDPWAEGTAAYKDVQTVRKLHLSLREQVINMTDEEFKDSYKIANPWCPMAGLLSQELTSLKTSMPLARRCLLRMVDESPCKPKGMNQLEMSMTQFAFMGLVLLYPKSFGVHYATEEDFEAYCHFWRGIGYLLGVEDHSNFCKGNVAEVRQRCRDAIDYWVKPQIGEYTPEWEHMSRCLTTGISYYVPPSNFIVGLLYLGDVLGLPMPAIRKSLDFSTWITYLMAKFMFHYLARFSRILAAMNRTIMLSIDNALKFNAERHEKLEQRSAKTLLDFVIS